MPISHGKPGFKYTLLLFFYEQLGKNTNDIFK